MHRVTKFNQEDRLKPYIDLNTKLRKKNVENDSERDIFKISYFWISLMKSITISFKLLKFLLKSFWKNHEECEKTKTVMYEFWYDYVKP